MKRLTTVLLLSLTLVFAVTTINAQNAADSRVQNARLDRTPYPKPEPQVVKEGLLGITEADIEAHQAFLTQPNTGLVRLLPREQNDSEVYKVEKRLDMRGGGAYFSFHFRAHPYGYGSDISLDRGLLSVGFAGADFGMLTDIGNVEIDSFNVNDPRAAFLLSYQPPTKEAEARLAGQKLYPNLSVDGVAYMRQIRGEVDHTYLVRSIVYDRSDVLVVFRVVKKDEDGSFIIAWKLLKEFSNPKLERNTVANNN